MSLLSCQPHQLTDFSFRFRNALNIVKDDLIVKVDELSGEVEILSEQLNTATQAKNKLNQKVADLEEELKKTKDLVKQQSNVDKRKIEIFNSFFPSSNIQIVQITKMKVMYQWLKERNSLALKWLVF